MAYATPAQLIERKNVETLGDLVADDGVRVIPADLLTDDNLQAALDDASGLIDATLLQAGHYTPTDLAGLTGNSQKHLVRITCEIAMCYLFARKPTYNTDEYETALKVQDLYLKRLRQGENVFNIQRNIDAGTPKYAAPSVAAVTTKGFIRDRTRNTYPARVSQSG